MNDPRAQNSLSLLPNNSTKLYLQFLNTVQSNANYSLLDLLLKQSDLTYSLAIQSCCQLFSISIEKAIYYYGKLRDLFTESAGSIDISMLQGFLAINPYPIELSNHLELIEKKYPEYKEEEKNKVKFKI